MIPAAIQILIMLLGAMLLGALIYRWCYCRCGKMCASGACCDTACGDKKCDDGHAHAHVHTAAKVASVAVPAGAVAHAVMGGAKKDDDLVIIEGIGPAIKKVLNAHGVHSFADVVATPKEKIHEWLNAAGPQFRMHDATTWAEQAALARDGKMEELEVLKKKLDNGQHA